MTSSSDWSTEDVDMDDRQPPVQTGLLKMLDMGDRQPPVQTGLLRMLTWVTDNLQFRLVY